MKAVVFYSWQSDLPNTTNRGFIQSALERAAARISRDDTVAVEPVIDRDTQGIPGAPDISTAIFAKIAAADAFVADVSLIQRPAGGRPCPNPNVLVELGYALRAIGHERIILVFNLAYGQLEELPFDLRMRRAVTYESPPEATERTPEREALSRQLENAIRTALEHAPVLADQPPTAIVAIENVAPNRLILLRRELERVLQSIVVPQPKLPREGGTTEDLIQAIEQSAPVIEGFAKLADIVASMDDGDAALLIYNWFSALLERYDLAQGFSGSFRDSDFDYFRFVGHELFVTLIACALREEKWAMISRMLSEPIALDYVRYLGRAGNVSWSYASKPAYSLANEGQRRGRASLHADLLNERHTSGQLASILPFENFIAADFLLFLKALLPADPAPRFLPWFPWSCLYMNSTPRFFLKAESRAYSDVVVRLLNLPSVDVFKARLHQRLGRLREALGGAPFWGFPITNEDIDRIGTG